MCHNIDRCGSDGKHCISSDIHDALKVRCAGAGVEDARMPILCGNEDMLVEAANQGW